MAIRLHQHYQNQERIEEQIPYEIDVRNLDGKMLLSSWRTMCHDQLKEPLPFFGVSEEFNKRVQNLAENCLIKGQLKDECFPPNNPSIYSKKIAEAGIENKLALATITLLALGIICLTALFIFFPSTFHIIITIKKLISFIIAGSLTGLIILSTPLICRKIIKSREKALETVISDIIGDYLKYLNFQRQIEGDVGDQQLGRLLFRNNPNLNPNQFRNDQQDHQEEEIEGH